MHTIPRTRLHTRMLRWQAFGWSATVDEESPFSAVISQGSSWLALETCLICFTYLHMAQTGCNKSRSTILYIVYWESFCLASLGSCPPSLTLAIIVQASLATLAHCKPIQSERRHNEIFTVLSRYSAVALARGTFPAHTPRVRTSPARYFKLQPCFISVP